MDSMKALRAHTRGGPEQFTYEDAPMPQAAPGEVLVAVHAAGVTYDELTWDLSWQTAEGADRTPVIPSHEVSGTVAALGPGVTDLAIGDDVYGLIDFDRDGAAAEFTTVPAGALAKRPAGISHTESAALPLAALTAWQALVDHARVQPGERVLVTGGAGGVGNYVVQLAAELGADVTATDRGGARDLLTGLGANAVIAFDQGQTPEAGAFDVVVDTVGGSALEASFAALRRGGRLITLTAPPPAGRAEQHGVTATFFVVHPDHAELAHLAELVEAGRLRPLVGRTFPLAQGSTAYSRHADQRTAGKTVLMV